MQEKEYTWCFACGKDNPIGLKMEFTMDAEECVAYFTPRQEHQSYDGRMHGGLISVLLDEIMGHYLFVTEGKPAYTAKIDMYRIFVHFSGSHLQTLPPKAHLHSCILPLWHSVSPPESMEPMALPIAVPA